MVIGIFGESCVGKSTVAAELQKSLNAEVYAGKDYLRLDKNESLARERFKELLLCALNGDDVIYVISEKDQLALLPDGAFRILVTAELATVKSRFAKRMNGNLPKPVELMLERKHGLFDNEKCDMHITETDGNNACARITELLRGRKEV